MIEYKIKRILKRRRVRKNRNSANRIYISRAEIKHTNTKILIILYTYNKQKYLIEQKMKNIIKFINNKKQKYLLKKKYFRNTLNMNKKSRLLSIIQKRFSFSKGSFAFYNKSINILIFHLLSNIKKRKVLFYILSNIKDRYFIIHRMSIIFLLKKLFILEQVFFKYAKLLNFNKFKFTNLLLNLKNEGLLSFISKIYNKNIELKIVELKSIQFSTDTFSLAVALKLRNRKNKAIKILSKAISNIVKLPYLHSFLISDDYIDNISKNNILNILKQRVVSGVRFEASGRLTRRLTASRAVFKYRYAGSLKNIRSSYNNKSSVLLRGHSKSNLQYVLINSKTRNGAFGLKGWVSSH